MLLAKQMGHRRVHGSVFKDHFAYLDRKTTKIEGGDIGDCLSRSNDVGVISIATASPAWLCVTGFTCGFAPSKAIRDQLRAEILFLVAKR